MMGKVWISISFIVFSEINCEVTLNIVSWPKRQLHLKTISSHSNMTVSELLFLLGGFISCDGMVPGLTLMCDVTRAS